MKTRTLNNWLTHRNITDICEVPQLRDLADQTLIHDRSVVIDRIAAEIQRGGLIVICSDYDVDGISSAVILTDVLRRAGGRVATLTASRFGGEGYGLSDVLCDKVMALKPALVVTCDFGSSDHDRIERLNTVGTDVCVIDHHLVPDRPLPSLAFINPHKPGCPSTFKFMCSGGLAWSVAGGLLRKLGMSKQIDVLEYLQFTAMATVADVMPLVGDNRTLVRHGLHRLRTTSLPGVKALLDLAKVDTSRPLTGRTIGFNLGPNLNAPGRLGPPDIVVRLLLSRDQGEADELAQEVGRLAQVRRDLTQAVQESAELEIEAAGWQHAPGIVVGREEWGHGIVGITAGRLVDKYGKPTIVIGSEGRGSVRGPAGSRLHDALTKCKEHMVKFGGHQAAAGCQIEWNSIDSLRSAWCAAISSQGAPTPRESLDLEIDPKDSLMDIIRDLETLEPCGQDNPRPRLVLRGRVVSAKNVKGHLSFEIQLNNSSASILKCFLVNKGEMAESLQGDVTVAGDFRTTKYGKLGVEMFVETLTS